MKRVEVISINGIMFSIVEDACRNLSDYLNVLYKHFEHEKDGNEIIADIEARIAELFSGRTGGTLQAITNEDVLHVIETLGAPEDIIDSDSDGDNQPPYENRKKQTKRLYRNPDQSILGGVCSGIASWLDINVILVRLIFIVCLLFYGITILVYFLLWIIIPMAKTTAQKLEMQGQAINISNIEKSIRENISSSNLEHSFNQFAGEAGGMMSKALKIIWRVICVIVGTSLFLFGIALLAGCCGVVLLQDVIFFHNIEWDFFSFNELLQRMISPVSYGILVICSVLIATMTVIACLYWGIKIIKQSKVKHAGLHFMMMTVWFLAVSTTVVTVIHEAVNYKWHNEVSETIHVNNNDTIYLSIHPSDLKISNNPLKIYYDKDDNRFYGKPDLFIRRSHDGNTKLEIRKQSQGRNKLKAFNYAENIYYEIDIADSLITLTHYFTVEPQDEWKNQQLDIFLYVPENTVIIIDQSLCCAGIIVSPRPWTRHNDNIWIMTSDGIKLCR